MKISSTLVLFFINCTTMQAQIFVKADAAGTNDGTSWTNAFTNLQDALDTADPGDELWLAAGTYTPEGPSPDSSHFFSN
ncbi:MAG: hypothetical protein M3R25_13670 [Bacteroidota bacterium]|nr:hypothetical protein [Bacteroidota bacterium]